MSKILSIQQNLWRWKYNLLIVLYNVGTSFFLIFNYSQKTYKKTSCGGPSKVYKPLSPLLRHWIIYLYIRDKVFDHKTIKLYATCMKGK